MLLCQRDRVRHRSTPAPRLDIPRKCHAREPGPDRLKRILRESPVRTNLGRKDYEKRRRAQREDTSPEEAFSATVSSKASKPEQSAHPLGSTLPKSESHQIRQAAPHSSDRRFSLNTFQPIGTRFA